ncbi:SRPBCC family protein [Robertkochia marina]|uniref:SRPBCC family protein n=1 Tax=Robertkochia marina TaxID=1227945 RepID=A0A4S3LXD4_9FLAO|nr:SRPBCC family protein [Robertkochia marina]THD65845.1 SRPBCC family protein [Robertkochia marina]
MKYELHVDIEKPAIDVLEIMLDPDNMKYWQRGFISITPVKGRAGKEGTTSILKYRFGNRKMELTETITKVNLPEEIHMTYQSQGIMNIQENYFTKTDKGIRWTTVSEFKFNSIFMKFIGLVRPGAFKAQSLRYMLDFKHYMETGIPVTNETH